MHAEHRYAINSIAIPYMLVGRWCVVTIIIIRCSSQIQKKRLFVRVERKGEKRAALSFSFADDAPLANAPRGVAAADSSLSRQRHCAVI